MKIQLLITTALLALSSSTFAAPTCQPGQQPLTDPATGDITGCIGQAISQPKPPTTVDLHGARNSDLDFTKMFFTAKGGVRISRKSLKAHRDEVVKKLGHVWALQPKLELLIDGPYKDLGSIFQNGKVVAMSFTPVGATPITVKLPTSKKCPVDDKMASPGTWTCLVPATQ